MSPCYQNACSIFAERQERSRFSFSIFQENKRLSHCLSCYHPVVLPEPGQLRVRIRMNKLWLTYDLMEPWHATVPCYLQEVHMMSLDWLGTYLLRIYSSSGRFFQSNLIMMSKPWSFDSGHSTHTSGILRQAIFKSKPCQRNLVDVDLVYQTIFRGWEKKRSSNKTHLRSEMRRKRTISKGMLEKTHRKFHP